MSNSILFSYLSEYGSITISLFVFFLIIVLLVLRPTRVISCNQRTFVDIQFSSENFYKSLEALIKSRKIPEVSVSKVWHSQGGILSSKREYLRVTRGDYVFDICAAPFGGDFFISTWLMERETNIFGRIPVIRRIFRLTREQKTFYELDTEAMFKGAIQGCVDKVIDKVVAVKGVRIGTTEPTKSKTNEE